MRLWRWIRGAVLGLSVVFASVMDAQVGFPAVVPGSDLEVYVMTMGPGDLVWERYGHNALGVRDLRTGEDVVYNWGTFSFEEPDFLLRFLSGRNRYWVQPGDAARTIAGYRQLDRSIWVQVLDLTPAQRLEVKRLVEDNIREENRYYRYDYFGDNCSTRIRDLLDQVLGGALGRQFSMGSGLTFRDEARRLGDPDRLAFAGIDFALGVPADREMTVYESMYVPMRLRDALRTATVPRVDGTGDTPLVRQESQLNEATREPERDHPRSQWPMFLAIGLLLGVALWSALRGTRSSLRRLVAVPWLVLAGVFGTILLLMWTATEHQWMYRNVNVLLFNPLWFAVIPLVWRVREPLPGWGRVLSQGLLGLLCVSAIIGAIGFPQQSGNFVLLAGPAHIAVLSYLLGRKRA